MKTLFTILSLAALAMASAIAEPSPAQNAATSAEATGKIVEFKAGSALVLDTGAGEPVHYKISKNITYINARGKMVKAGKMKKDRKIRVRYAKEGNDLVVDKVTVVKN